MRLSAESGDPDNRPECYRAKIFFNGSPFKMAIAADEERGMIKTFADDEQGRPRSCHCREEFMTKLLFGDVKIVLEA